MKNTKLRREMGEIAREVLQERGDDLEVCRQVEALVGSLEDTLSEEFILEKLKALKAGGPTFSRILADNSNS